MLDMSDMSGSGLQPFSGEDMKEIAVAKSQAAGILTGEELSQIFAWLRPNDLVWNYWINNYLMGKEPPVFDVLYWNSDATNLTAALHRDFLNITTDNSLSRPGATVIRDTPIDVSKLKQDVMYVAGMTDHLTPWKTNYRSSKLLGGNVDFILFASGHIQTIVNPPGNPKARYFTNEDYPETPEEFLEGATEHHDSWWLRWKDWLGERAGEQKPAPKSPGSKKYKPLYPAPGHYVLARVLPGGKLDEPAVM